MNLNRARTGGRMHEPVRPNRRLSREQRLTRSSQIREAFNCGQKQVGRFMVLWTRPGEDAALRLGVVASKKVGNAVHRNRAKRRLREAWRLLRHRLTGPTDVVLVARRPVCRAAWADVTGELETLTRRAGLLTETEHDEKTG